MPILDCYPKFYKDWLFTALELTAGEETKADVLEPLFAMNRAWRDGGTLPADYFAELATLRAYSLYYMTINMPKLWFLLSRAGIPPAGTLVDLGSGPGTLVWAWLFYLAKYAPERLQNMPPVIGIERTAEAVALAERLAESLRNYAPFESIDVSFRCADWQQAGGQYDLVLGGNVLMECADSATDALRDFGPTHALLIEPGNRPGFLRMLGARDALVATGHGIQFPCPAHAVCPLAADNWCNFTVNRAIVPFVQRMSNQAGRLNHRHHFSGLVTGPAAPETAASWRVLSDVRKVHRSGVRYLCNGRVAPEVVVSRRKKSSANEFFLRAETGALLRIQPGPDAVRGKLQAATRVEPLDA